MKILTAKTTFLINRDLWSEGDTKEVGDNQGLELLKAGLVVEKMVEAPKASTTTPKSAKKPRLKPENRETKPAKTQDLEQK